MMRLSWATWRWSQTLSLRKQLQSGSCRHQSVNATKQYETVKVMQTTMMCNQGIG
jgi:hypothetical protein